MTWQRNKPIKIKDVAKFPFLRKPDDVREAIRGLHGDGFDYFVTIPTKQRGITIWYGRTERESPTHH